MENRKRLCYALHQNAKVKSWNYIKKYYPTYVSKSERFKELLLPYLNLNIDMVDLGCGRGLETSIPYRELTRCSYGLDISESVFSNRTIHHPLQGSVYDIPLPEASVDLAVNQELLEHLEFPQQMFHETARILRPNGIFAVMTPNLWDPFMIVSFLTPYSFHKFVNRVLYDIDPADVFPTWYRANTLGSLKKLGARAGLELVRHEYFKCNPGSLSFSPTLTRLEVAYSRLISKYDALSFLRDIVIVFFRKPPASKS
jgi:SAM-dependent methyltransferase